MKVVKFVFAALVAVLFASCQQTKSQEELYAETQSGSVMICTKYYYQITLPNNNVLYFTGLDSDGDFENLTDDATEIDKECSRVTGTGFFVDKLGSILTNRHVVSPELEDSKVKKAYKSLMSNVESYYSYIKRQLSNQYDELEQSKSQYYYYDGYDIYANTEKINEIENQQQEILQSYQEAGETLSSISDIKDPSDLKIKTITEIGIAYNDTHITGEKDMLDKNPCVVIRTSGKDDVDLALIQLKNKKTPEDKYIFSIAEKREKNLTEKFSDIFGNKDDGTLKMGQQLYMIGYNAGPILASTKTGVKVQMTSGKVTQPSDGQRLLYDIATVSGSSGSPVIDENGNLVAVNFAKLRGSDNFNFGIPIERVKEFMKW